MKRQIFLPVLHNHPYFCFPESVGWSSDRPQHSIVRHENELDSFNLHLIVNGKGYLESNGVTYTLQQGDSFFYFPLQKQLYYSDLECPWEVVWVHFNGKLLKEFFMEMGYHQTKVWTLNSWKILFSNIILLLEEAEQSTILYPATLSALTYGVISEFITNASPLTRNRGFELFERITDILPEMRECSSRPFELQTWADHLNISSYYFCKSFKRVTGMTPTNFIKLCRLQKAKQLLLEKPDWSIKQIAIEVGYPSISYFGSVFLENEHESPGEYRRKHLS